MERSVMFRSVGKRAFPVSGVRTCQDTRRYFGYPSHPRLSEKDRLHECGSIGTNMACLVTALHLFNARFLLS